MIGKKIKEYRQNLKLTGETLANLAGIQRSYLSQIENEKKYPPLDTLINLVNAIAHISPINDENASDILTEENYKEFRIAINFIPHYQFENTIDIYIISNPEISTSLYFEHRPSNKEIEQGIREYFFGFSKEIEISSFDLTTYNLLDNNSLLYKIDDLRNSLYEWWYNHILQDFMKSGIKDSVIYVDEEINEIDRPLSAYDVNLSEGDRKLLAELWPLMNESGIFTANNDDDNTNVTKELLEGKKVTFDLKSFSDKNVKLLLEGQLLSNPEMAILKVALDAIKYNRQKNN
ncbi:helix-turn-helix domain-containing protein [Lactococcus lactis]|uniref:helix-turn-helix domain-containing protein n=1 Tax=Lactococcus lactis TaxID=1358 RepID=UPI001C1FA102|nr:helix-turn-helix transcriptional regulator [Lactococcus lactis]MBU7531118.1 helix-turn-helix transcriptional regulator [Lactococcus lactis]